MTRETSKIKIALGVLGTIIKRNCRLLIVRQQLVVAHRAVVRIERAHRVGGRVEHLFGHRDRIGKLFEIEQREFFGRRHRNDLVVQIAEEIFDRLQLSFDQLDRFFELVERCHTTLENFDVGLLDAFRTIVGRRFHLS